jgi:geranylgeranyl transferase type-2 subunit beta
VAIMVMIRTLPALTMRSLYYCCSTSSSNEDCQLRSIDTDRLARYTAGLQQPNGSFFGDKWGEVDTRFSYCGLSTLALLNRLELIDVPKAAEYCLNCLNFDGSFGGIPGAESHGAYVFCCVGALKIAGFIESFDHDELAKWLCERQTAKGGFNGRP